MKISTFYEHIASALAAHPELSAEQLADMLMTAGITGIEMDLADYDRDGDRILGPLMQAGMRVSGIYGFHHFGEGETPAESFRHVDVAKKLGATAIMPIPGFLSEEEASELNAITDDLEKAAAWLSSNPKTKAMAAGDREMVRYAREVYPELLVVMEDFDLNTSPFATLAGLNWLMKEVPELGFAMDTGNFVYSDEDALAGYAALHDRVVHIHCKDRGEEAEVLARGNRFNRGLSAVPVGDGYMPVEAVVKDALSGGYRGWFAIEHFGAKDSLSYMLRSAEYLRSLAAKYER